MVIGYVYVESVHVSVVIGYVCMYLVGNARVSEENVHACLVGIDYACSVGIGRVYLEERAHVLVENDPASFVEERVMVHVFYVEERETRPFVEMEGRASAYTVMVVETRASFSEAISLSSEPEKVSRVSEVKVKQTVNCHVSYPVELYSMKKTQAVYVEGIETPQVTRLQRMRIPLKEWLSCVSFVLTGSYALLCRVSYASLSDVGEGWAPRPLPLNSRLDVCSR